MRILILGGDGMLGHQLYKHMRSRHDVYVTLRKELAVYKEFDLFTESNALTGIDVRNSSLLEQVITDHRPDAIINAVGVVKQRSEASQYIPSIEINSLLPHQLADICKPIHTRLVHMSTDCVFSGKKGNYKESDPSDCEDLYGKTKYLGEVHDKTCITLRTSIIGTELSRKKSLLEWFLAQKRSVKGFKNAIFSGFTTIEMSRIIEMLLQKFPAASGLYHVSSTPISKYDLLVMLKEALDFDIGIDPDEAFKCDHSLDSTRFQHDFNYQPPSWQNMINQLSEAMTEAKK